eukprot:359211-Chlamydomonas_euryale.AAC.3
MASRRVPRKRERRMRFTPDGPPHSSAAHFSRRAQRTRLDAPPPPPHSLQVPGCVPDLQVHEDIVSRLCRGGLEGIPRPGRHPTSAPPAWRCGREHHVQRRRRYQLGCQGVMCIDEWRRFKVGSMPSVRG